MGGKKTVEAWDYAVGMIKADGLEPTKEYIEKEKRGEVTMPGFGG